MLHRYHTTDVAHQNVEEYNHDLTRVFNKKLISSVFQMVLIFCINLQTEKNNINKYQRETYGYRRIRLRP